MRRVAKLVLLFLIVVLAASSAEAGRRRALEFEPVYSGFASWDPNIQGEHVFRDRRAWCAFWSQAIAGASPPLACPAVDFRRRVVIAIVVAEGGCNRSEIAAIVRTGRHRAKVVVRDSLLAPNATGCYCVASFWDAMRAVAVERPIRRVEFAHEPVALDCR